MIRSISRSPLSLLTSLLLVPLLLAITATSTAAQLVSGRVIEEGTDQPIGEVTIELADSTGLRRASAISDTAGNFRIMAPLPGRYILRVSHIAFRPIETRVIDAEMGQEVKLELRLSPSAVVMDPLRVVGRSRFNAGWLQEYYDRAVHTRQTGIGRVFFRDEIEREGLPYASAYLTFLRPRGNCQAAIFVDGLEVTDARELDAFMRPDILEGVELYNNATMLPPRYTNRGYCAIALFWTRRELDGARPFSWKRAFLGAGLAAGILLLVK